MEALRELIKELSQDIFFVDFALAALIFLVFVILRNILTRTVLASIKRFTKSTKTTIDEKFVDAIYEPIQWMFLLIGFSMARSVLSLGEFDMILTQLIVTAGTVIFYWFIYRIVDKFGEFADIFSNKLGRTVGNDIKNFVVKTLKIVVVIFCVMSILHKWNINVSAFVASLGLGGLAFALAAKDTVSNLFGSIVVFSDRPFKVGDWIKADNLEGVVEDIGIRSTKIRTFSQSLINVPNATLANSSITNWSQMKKRRVKMHLNLTYDTTPSQMQEILNDIRGYLKANQKVHPDVIMVNFEAFGDSSLDILCYFFTKTTVWAEHLNAKEEINLEFMRIIEKHKASFAFPSRTLYMQNAN